MNDLKTLALAAKGWNLDTIIPATDEKGCEVGTTLDDEFYHLMTLECEDYYKDSVPLANFFVAASPDAILKLLEERDQWEVDCREEVILRRNAEAERDRLREALTKLLAGVDGLQLESEQQARQALEEAR